MARVKPLCNFCKIPITADDYTGIPAHVVCVTRFLEQRRSIDEIHISKSTGMKPRQGLVKRICKHCKCIVFWVHARARKVSCTSCQEELKDYERRNRTGN